MFGSRFLSKGACAAAAAIVVTSFASTAFAAGVNYPLAAQLSRMERERSYVMAIPFGPMASFGAVSSSTANSNNSAACFDGYRWMHLKRTTEPVRCTS
jgi:hypothetical protein